MSSDSPPPATARPYAVCVPSMLWTLGAGPHDDSLWWVLAPPPLPSLFWCLLFGLASYGTRSHGALATLLMSSFFLPPPPSPPPLCR